MNMNNDYQYGLDVIEDIRHLYGENYEEINKLRYKLFKSLDGNIHAVQMLRCIIQNPVPITKQQFKEWIEIKNNILKENQYDLTLRTIHTLRSIEDFVYDYHIVG